MVLVVWHSEQKVVGFLRTTHGNSESLPYTGGVVKNKFFRTTVTTSARGGIAVYLRQRQTGPADQHGEGSYLVVRRRRLMGKCLEP
jgi:hypothetical protein